MFDRITKRIAYRTSPVRRFFALHPGKAAGFATAGIAGAMAVTGSVLAIMKRFRNHSSPQVELLSVNGPAHEQADITRDELYEMARQRDIPGRSSMTKAELRDALAAQ